jgi:hypothetical protein
MHIPFISSGLKETFNLIEGKAHSRDAEPISLRSTDLTERVPLHILESLYRRDPDVFAAINHRVRTFMSSSYSIQAEDPKVKSWFENFLRNIRFDIILDKVATHESVYGNAWVELVKGKSSGLTVGADVLDPKIMDFGRDSNLNIIYDSQNNPAYYVLMLMDGMTVPEHLESRVVQHNPRKETAGTQGVGIRFEPNEVAHFTLRTVGDQLDGIGLIEPMYNSLVSKIRIEKDWAIAVKKAASPLIVAKSGNDIYRPTDGSMEKLNNILKDIDSKSVITLPYHDDIEVKTIAVQSLEPNLSYFVDKIAASTGVPKPYIVGSGDKTPRSTFKGLNLGYERDIKEWHKRVGYDFETQFFKVICDEQGFDEVPCLVFESPSLEYLDAKASRIVDYTNAGLLYPDKGMRVFVRRMEGLPDEPEDIEAEIQEKKKDMLKRNEEQVDKDKEIAKEEP